MRHKKGIKFSDDAIKKVGKHKTTRQIDGDKDEKAIFKEFLGKK